MSAELLREAAALMRERANAATQGPWEWEPSYPAIYGQGGTVVVAAAGIDSSDDPDPHHIVSWHPAVALAVADWLTSVAAWPYADAYMGPHFIGPAADTAKAALAVARAYLGRS